MLVIPGLSAISEFRKEKAIGHLCKAMSNCPSHRGILQISVDAKFVYFVDLKNPLNEHEKGILAQLLNLGATDFIEHSGKDNPVYLDGYSSSGTSQTRTVIPRLGTISPWATKATDIFHHCGLEQINRIERGTRWRFAVSGNQQISNKILAGVVYDPMTESILEDPRDAEKLFATEMPTPLVIIDLLGGGLKALKVANEKFGFALSAAEQSYLVDSFKSLGRNPTDVELMMFAQVNSEHCRHKIFNADWDIDGVSQAQSLFAMIRHTHTQNRAGTLSAYDDNAAVLEGSMAQRLAADGNDHGYRFQLEPVHFTAKVETHNHPTAISPFPGASTGCGGEIRDEGATGRGGKPKAGLVGYTVSHLRLPDLPQPWEATENKPERIASPLQIMLEGPVGAAAFNNEFGRPSIAGYFRSFEQVDHQPGSNGRVRHGYHKPIMLAGGLGNIRPRHVKKLNIPDGAPIVVLGGPTMLIGLGGGAASSVASGTAAESLDFASVQRGNPEMQRRCQEVIDACCAEGEDNPILSIHDVGAGGLCNALPELVHDSDCGGDFELRKILNDEPGMSPMQIWCNESQERYVIAIDRDKYPAFEKICQRERCLFAQIGTATKALNLALNDDCFNTNSPKPIDLPMEILFGLPPKMQRHAESIKKHFSKLNFNDLELDQAVERVLSFPAVGDKTFLVTIGDRSVSGLVARDQMVGPWQVPVADVGVTASGYKSVTGEAFAIGERTPIAVIDAPASGRMAIGEAITNIAAAAIERIDKIKLSANWMVAAGEQGHDAALYATVKSIALDICPQLGIAIPVGKDSMSMKTVWRDKDNNKNKVVAPLSLIVSSFAAVTDVRKTLTPVLSKVSEQTDLWLIDLGFGKNRMGASVLAQVANHVTNQMGDEVADLDDAQTLQQFFELIQRLNNKNLILSYHDRSDGGLMTTLCEMAFASRCGLSVNLDSLSGVGEDNFAVLFNEELGAVVQTRHFDRDRVLAAFERANLSKACHFIGRPEPGNNIELTFEGKVFFEKPRSECHRIWSQTTWQIQRMRDNPVCADQEYQRINDNQDPGLFCDLSFDHGEDANQRIISTANILPINISIEVKPKIAVLREQGVNGQLEMAAAFHSVGFEAVDVTMTDLVNGATLADFKGIAACGGFSFGDVLGAGEGWGKSILFNPRLKDQFEKFFNRADTFSLGVCNGCQMMSSIKSLIPGATHWPKFLRNTSEQYEARVAMVEVCSEKSVLFEGMASSKFPVSVAHGEGRADFESDYAMNEMQAQDQLCLRFIDNRGDPTATYPYNSNGSIHGMTGFTNHDGRATIMMPHPERVFRTLANSWHPDGWGEYSPWIRIFRNARAWVD
ncbi:phosphoribosylformylglycinamidine synthase [Candidatus Spongiihabitans sp.]|uniref:phosphoribosylformylglycinamidine synthase n=1 Tax=Candidatus Spongiihabitans sp. TaxID=3101308 RepID=UPI003C6EEAF5